MQSYSSILILLLGVFVGGVLMHVLLSWVWRNSEAARVKPVQESENDSRAVVDWPMLERNGEVELREPADFAAWLNKGVTARPAADREARVEIPSS